LPQRSSSTVFSHYEIWKNDFAHKNVLTSIISGNFDYVVHLAAIPRVGYSVAHPVKTNKVNVSKTLKLMDACVKGKVKRFIFASSSSVYGDASPKPSVESAIKSPQSPYALQKSIIEDYLKMYNTFYGLDSVCLRFFNVFGPNALGSSPYATALASWLTSIKKGEKMRSDGDGTQSRDLCYVDNVVSAIQKSITSTTNLNANCYNVACGESVTNQQIIDCLLKRYSGSSVVSAPERLGDVKHTLANIQRARTDLGYVPIVNVWEGILKTCDWYDSNWSWISKLEQKI
jgi:UDP-N-acetylglucosamine/UDP-N-acetylgalactosamine 4-epimerase